MMHKRNTAIVASVLAAVILALFSCFNAPNEPKAVGYLYFPVILISVIISGHSPSEITVTTAFIVYTLAYLVIFLAIYVALVEIYLLKKVFHHLDEAKANLASDQPDKGDALGKIGLAIKELEARRRKHFLLQPMKIDVNREPRSLAADLIASPSREAPVRRVYRKIQAGLKGKKSPVEAALIMQELKQEAERMSRGSQQSGQ